jgi:hypothetical protein
MLRLAALMGAGTFAVHQARYAFGYRAEASDALAAHGHAYLAPVAPVIAGAVILCLAELVRRVARGAPAAAPRFGRLWAGTTVALLAVYVVQELVEGALAAHHPGGLFGVAGNGGWVALPLAMAFGLAISLLMRGASAAAELTAPRRPWRAPAPLAPRHTRMASPVGAPLLHTALGRAARGPPVLCC